MSAISIPGIITFQPCRTVSCAGRPIFDRPPLDPVKAGYFIGCKKYFHHSTWQPGIDRLSTDRAWKMPKARDFHTLNCNTQSE
jgi:hypothetical protein